MADSPTLVLLHGLASTPREFSLIAHPLRRLGVDLHTPEIRGYSHASLARPARWQDWVRAAHEVADGFARASRPFVLGGLCTGALVAVAVAAQVRSASLQGLALLSPTFAYDGWALPWWYRLRKLAYLLGLEERFSMREQPPYGLKNERLRQWVRQQMDGAQATLVGPARVSLQAVRESERISRHALACLRTLDMPTMVLHARDDEICSLQSVQSALARAPAGRIRMNVLENSYHMITADNDRQQVAAMLAEHLSRAAGSDDGQH
jgi:carboxylesterase